MVYVYNCLRNESIGYLLYFLVFGWNLRLFIDFIFDIKEDGLFILRVSYVEEWEVCMMEVYKIFGGMVRRVGEKVWKYYDCKFISVVFKFIVGD